MIRLLKSFKTEINPTEEQKIKIHKTIGTCRYIYNFYLFHNKELYTLGKKFIYPFKLLLNCFKSLFIYIKVRPKYIVSTGAHTAGPMCLIGKIFGSKIIFIETFANSKTKSKTGSIVYKFADLFIVQWKEMLELYPGAIYGGWIF